MYSTFLRGMISRSPIASLRQRPAVGLDEAGDHVRAAVFAAAALHEHGVGLADARRHPEVDAQTPVRAGAGLAADALEHLFGGGAAVFRHAY